LSVGDSSFKKKSEEKLDELISKCKVLVCASQNHELLKTICNKFLLLENNNIKIISPKDF
jgi:ABC-type polysaccharide/polyol phosphate transport system ATPase subunit